MASSNAPDNGELRRKAGRSIQAWAKLLAERLSADDAWRLLLAGALNVSSHQEQSSSSSETPCF
jgi:hypothetical protein